MSTIKVTIIKIAITIIGIVIILICFTLPMVSRINNTDKTSYLTFQIGDNESTFKMLDSIVNMQSFDKNKLNIFCEICAKSDGALSEVLGDYCYKIINRYPKEVITEFQTNSKMMEYFGSFIAFEFYSNDYTFLSPEVQSFLQHLENKIPCDNIEMIETYDKFKTTIETTLCDYFKKP